MTNDRVYQLTYPAFLHEPATVNRCQLVDDVEQKNKFEKYQSLINVPQTPLTPPAAENSQGGGGDPNSSYISLDNIEIQIKCVERRKTPLNQMTKIENQQYVVEIVDMRRIKCSFPQSPILKVQSNSSNTPLHTKTVNNQFHLKQQQQQQQQQLQQQLPLDDYDENETTQTRSLTIVETLTTTEREYDRQNNLASSYRKTNGVSSRLSVRHAAINGSAIQATSLTSAITIAEGDNTMNSLVINDCSSVCESTRITHAQDDMSQCLSSSDATSSMPRGERH